MTSQGTAQARELALREMGTPSLLVALDCLELLADARPDKFDPAAVRWHGRLEVETVAMTIGGVPDGAAAPPRPGFAPALRRAGREGRSSLVVG